LADLGSYSQDFEGLDQADPAALTNDGWLVFANVFGLDWAYWYGYGPFPAPNGGPGFSGIDIGQGGAEQGDQQLVTYSDYNNGDHPWANIQALVFQEQIVGAADVGNVWRFYFDGKRGNMEPNTTAAAFIKTLDPNNGYVTTNEVSLDLTNITDSWGSYSMAITIDATLPGQILQFGFLNVATNYTPSGVFYDNINFAIPPPPEPDVEGIPTVSEWGLILITMMLLIMGAGALYWLRLN